GRARCVPASSFNPDGSRRNSYEIARSRRIGVVAERPVHGGGADHLPPVLDGRRSRLKGRRLLLCPPPCSYPPTPPRYEARCVTPRMTRIFSTTVLLQFGQRSGTPGTCRSFGSSRSSISASNRRPHMLHFISLMIIRKISSRK